MHSVARRTSSNRHLRSEGYAMLNASRARLDDVRESYFEHLVAALRIALLMIRAGLACAIHAIVPALCTTTASRCLAEVQQLFAERQADKVGEQSLHRAHGRLWGS